MEAMACACCPIASRVGGNPELIEHGQNGLLFEVDNVADLGNQIRELVVDAPRRKTFAAVSAEKMLQFSYAKAAKTMQEIYESVLSSSSRGRRVLPHSG
jgi:glycosyltransferase involved in cell wall biosynthesis